MSTRLSVCGASVLVASLLFSSAARPHEFVATVTLSEGANTVVSGANGFAPAIGMKLRHCDLLASGPGALLQIEFDEGGMIEVGPDTRLVADLPQRRGRRGDEPVIGPHFLLSGWIKFTAPKRVEGQTHRVNTPFFDLLVDEGVAVLQVVDDGAQLFVERGEVTTMATSGRADSRVTVGAGRMFSGKGGQAAGELEERMSPAFVSAMPPVFRDTLPPRLTEVGGRSVELQPASAEAYRDAAAWLRRDPEVLRVCFS